MKTAMLLCVALIPGIAAAAGASSKQDNKKNSGLICRDIDETGSRLSSQRVCMTKEQWEENRRQARETVDRAQTQQTNPKGY